MGGAHFSLHDILRGKANFKDKKLEVLKEDGLGAAESEKLVATLTVSVTALDALKEVQAWEARVLVRRLISRVPRQRARRQCYRRPRGVEVVKQRGARTLESTGAAGGSSWRGWR